MKTLLTFLALSTFCLAQAQDQFTEANAIAVVDQFFDGFHKGDTTIMSAVIAKNAVMQTAFATPQGENRLSNGSVDNLLDAIANRPDTQLWEEKLLSYGVQIDGNLAQVWTPYEFYLDGNFSHCGANAFTMVKTDDGWRIIHLIDSRRRSSCKTD